MKHLACFGFVLKIAQVNSAYQEFAAAEAGLEKQAEFVIPLEIIYHLNYRPIGWRCVIKNDWSGIFY